MAIPTAEAGHQPNRVYYDASGSLHVNGAPLVGANDDHFIPEYDDVTILLGALAAHTPVYTAPNDGLTRVLKTASVRFSTASSSGTVQVEVAGAAIAPGSGTNQLTGTISLAGTANTTANGTIIASPTNIVGGTSVNVVVAGTMTGLAGAVLTLTFARTV